MVGQFDPESIRREVTESERRDAAGTVEKRKTTTWIVDTPDWGVGLVFVLCVVLLVIALANKDMRNAVFTGALPTLFSVFTLAVGGLGAYKLFTKLFTK